MAIKLCAQIGSRSGQNFCELLGKAWALGSSGVVSIPRLADLEWPATVQLLGLEAANDGGLLAVVILCAEPGGVSIRNVTPCGSIWVENSLAKSFPLSLGTVARTACLSRDGQRLYVVTNENGRHQLEALDCITGETLGRVGLPFGGDWASAGVWCLENTSQLGYTLVFRFEDWVCLIVLEEDGQGALTPHGPVRVYRWTNQSWEFGLTPDGKSDVGQGANAWQPCSPLSFPASPWGSAADMVPASATPVTSLPEGIKLPDKFKSQPHPLPTANGVVGSRGENGLLWLHLHTEQGVGYLELRAPDYTPNTIHFSPNGLTDPPTFESLAAGDFEPIAMDGLLEPEGLRAFYAEVVEVKELPGQSPGGQYLLVASKWLGEVKAGTEPAALDLLQKSPLELNAVEAQHFVDHPWQLPFTTILAIRALMHAALKYEDKPNAEEMDAARHVIFSASMAKFFGAETAKVIMDNHEAVSQDPMDFHNNEVGYYLAKKYPESKHFAMVKEALKAGALALEMTPEAVAKAQANFSAWRAKLEAPPPPPKKPFNPGNPEGKGTHGKTGGNSSSKKPGQETPKPNVENPKPETESPKPEIEHPKPEWDV